MEKKYELTDETKTVWSSVAGEEITLHRIKAVRDVISYDHEVRAFPGALGGWVQSEENLSHENGCWIYDEAEVFDNAKVIDDAIVQDFAKVFDNATVSGYAKVFNHSIIRGSAVVKDYAFIVANAYISGGAEISYNAEVSDDAEVYGNVKVTDKAFVGRSTRLSGNLIIGGNIDLKIPDSLYSDELRELKRDTDIEVFKNNWSSGRYFFYLVPYNEWQVGCFTGTGQELIEKAYADGEEVGKYYEKYVRFVEDSLLEGKINKKDEKV